MSDDAFPTIPAPPIVEDTAALLGEALSWLLMRPGLVQFSCTEDDPMHWTVSIEYEDTCASAGDRIRYEAIIRLARMIGWSQDRAS